MSQANRPPDPDFDPDFDFDFDEEPYATGDRREPRSRFGGGCWLPVALLLGLAFAYGVAGLLALAGVAFVESTFGQALIATAVTLSVGLTAFTWLRARARTPGGLLQIALVALASGGILFLALRNAAQTGQAVDLASDAGREQALTLALFALAMGAAAVLWLRRMMASVLRLLVILLLLLVALAFAVQAGLVELPDLSAIQEGLEQLNPTAPPPAGPFQ